LMFPFIFLYLSLSLIDPSYPLSHPFLAFMKMLIQNENVFCVQANCGSWRPQTGWCIFPISPSLFCLSLPLSLSPPPSLAFSLCFLWCVCVCVVSVCMRVRQCVYVCVRVFYFSSLFLYFCKTNELQLTH
jgi:hypothetical protein